MPGGGSMYTCTSSPRSSIANRPGMHPPIVKGQEIAHDIAQRDRRIYHHVAYQRSLQKW